MATGTQGSLWPSGRPGSVSTPFTVLSILLAVVLWQESRAADGLARYIAPYPAINGVTWIPPVPGSSSRHWMFTTADRPVVVARYYTDPNHHPGWTLEEMAGSFLVLKKRNQLPANRDRQRFERAEQREDDDHVHS